MVNFLPVIPFWKLKTTNVDEKFHYFYCRPILNEFDPKIVIFFVLGSGILSQGCK